MLAVQRLCQRLTQGAARSPTDGIIPLESMLTNIMCLLLLLLLPLLRLLRFLPLLPQPMQPLLLRPAVSNSSDGQLPPVDQTAWPHSHLTSMPHPS
jgi:hypothetical protein